jgi:hypothetical protein
MRTVVEVPGGAVVSADAAMLIAMMNVLTTRCALFKAMSFNVPPPWQAITLDDAVLRARTFLGDEATVRDCAADTDRILY